MYLVDTNIFLELLLDQAKKEQCKKFLRQLRNGKTKGVLTDFTIHSIMVMMLNLGKIKELKISL
jgi:uncharacterized protein